MKQVFAFTLVMALATALTGCTTNSTARAREKAAYLAGQRSAASLAPQKPQLTVTVHGEVTHSQIPWTGDLTLARAIVAAGYNGLGNPRVIEVTRNGETVQYDPRRLLRGEDFNLEPGDVVELRQ